MTFAIDLQGASMTDKSSPVGWVIQVVSPTADGAVPVFKYFNVNVSDVAKATEAARKRAEAGAEARIEAIRELSAAEIAALRLHRGQAKPA